MSYKDLQKQKEYGKKKYQENKEEIKEKSKKYRKENPEKVKKMLEEWREKNPEYRKNYYQEHQEEEKKYAIKWQKDNPEKVKKCNEKWKKENSEKIKKIKRKYEKNRKKRDIKFHINKNIATFISISLKEQKAGRKWQNLVGYTLKNLMTRLEFNFDEKMSWNNYGSYWHIDHKKPKSLFKYEKPKDKGFKDCWCLANLQPLEKMENMKKGDYFKGRKNKLK